MPPKKNVNKTREPVTSTTKSLGPRRVKKNTLSGKNVEPVTKIHNHEDVSGKSSINEESQKKTQTQDDNLLSKRDINIMLANEVLKTQFPSKIPILNAIERAIVDEIDVPKNIFKRIKKVPLKQKTIVAKKIVKRKKITKSNLSIQETCSNTTEHEDNNEVVSDINPMKIKRIRKLNLKKKQVQDNKEAVSKIAPMKINRIRKLNLKKKQVQEDNNEAVSNIAPIKINRIRKLNLNKKQVQTNKLHEDKPKYNKKIRNTPENKIQRRGRPKKRNIEEICSIVELKTENPKEIMKSPLPVKRKKNIPTNILSRSSSSSDLSWTRDISSCSTTSCVSVSSNDFVLIDNKLPIIKLKNINPKPVPTCLRNTLRQSTQSSSKLKGNETINEELFKAKGDEESFQKSESDILDSAIVPPVLSSSSSSNSSSSTSLTENTSCVSNNNQINDLFMKLRSIDLEVIAWVGFNNINSCSTPKLDQFKEKLENCNVLREERNLLQQLKIVQKQLYKYSKNDASNKIAEDENKNDSQEDITFVKPNRVNQTNYKNRVSQVDGTPEKPAQSSDNLAVQNNISDSLACNNSNKCLDENDDDDALSLYAESITGLDSSRRSSSIQRVPDARRNEEYIPEFVTKKSKVPVTFYKPSRIEITHETEQNIEDKQENQNNVVAAICEKQNADSTSLNKEQENDKNTTEEVTIFEDRQGNIEKTNFNANLYNTSKPLYPNQTRLLAQNYKFIRGSRSAIFNVCYFNLESRCLHKNCKFNHIIPSTEEIENKVASLDEDSFIAEYMLTRTMHSLRRTYGICFVNDCIRRKLTRLLVEMVTDFVLKGDYNNSEDNALTTDVVERTLLYLNNVDLNVCRDLLNFRFMKFKGLLLCDYLLKFIAESPNFTRFIPIFIKLAWYISGMDLRFDIQISTLLLERVCILPYDDKLARALIEVIKNTNDTIFFNHMIEKFEKMLMISNKDLYDSFAFLKKRKILNQSIANSCNGGGYIENDVRYSPDTTNLDNLNKTTENKLTRTIENKVSSQYTNELSSKSPFQEGWNLPSSSRCGETNVFGLNGQYQSMKASSFPKGLDLQSGYKRLLDMPFPGNHPNKIRRTIHADHVNFKRGNTSMPSNSSSGSDDRGHTTGMRSRGSPYAGRGMKRGMFMRRNHLQFRNMRKSDGPRFF